MYSTSKSCNFMLGAREKTGNEAMNYTTCTCDVRMELVQVYRDCILFLGKMCCDLSNGMGLQFHSGSTSRPVQM